MWLGGQGHLLKNYCRFTTILKGCVSVPCKLSAMHGFSKLLKFIDLFFPSSNMPIGAYHPKKIKKQH